MLREGTFFIGGGGGGGGGLRGGGSSVNFLRVGEGQTCLFHRRGRVTLLSGTEKILLTRNKT